MDSGHIKAVTVFLLSDSQMDVPDAAPSGCSVLPVQVNEGVELPVVVADGPAAEQEQRGKFDL